MAQEGSSAVRGFIGKDLPEGQRLALEEGHDADIPTNEGIVNPTDGKIIDPAKEQDIDNPNRHSSTSSTSHGANETNDPEKAQPAATSQEHDPNLVDWDGPDDPMNPMNWSAKKKWSNIFILSTITLLVPLGSSFFAPGVPQVMREFGTTSQSLTTFVVSVYVLGFAFGPLVIAPMSELHGRLPVYHVCNFAFLCWTIGAALAPSMDSLIAFRFLQGLFGVAVMTLGGGTIGDIMEPAKRGGAMAIWALGPLLGPVIGPVAGGFLSENVGWRWIFWVLAIATGVVAIAAFFVMGETYAPILLETKTKRLQKETGNMDLISKLDNGLSVKELFIRALVRPSKLMFLSPICALMALYMAIVYGVFYLLFTTFTFVFEDLYGFSTSTVGLVYIGTGIGMLLGLGVLGFSSDRIVKHLAAKNNGVLKPEFRLPPLMYAGPLIPVGLFIYGWTAQYQTHWVVPLFGTLVVGVGLIAAFMCINTYLVDCFGVYAASAIAANTVLRSIFGSVMPLFGLQMYDAMGLGWGNSLLAFIMLAMTPIPYWFYVKGEWLRTNPKFQVNL